MNVNSLKGCLLIINYNGYKHLSNSLLPLKYLCAKAALDFIVADDTSSDDSCDFLLNSDVDVIVNRGHKKGYAANANYALINLTEKKKYDYFIISNNDIIVNESFIDAFLDAINSVLLNYNSVGVIGFKEVLLMNMTPDYFASRPQSLNIQESDFVPGFFYIVFSRVFDKIGFFDEDYHMYGEEIDFFFRARKSGFKIFNTNLEILHFSEGSAHNRKKERFNSWLAYRNALLYAKKNLSFIGNLRIFLSLANQIYNPFFSPIDDPSYHRITRNGIFINTYFLFKSILWNYFKF